MFAWCPTENGTKLPNDVESQGITRDPEEVDGKRGRERERDKGRLKTVGSGLTCMHRYILAVCDYFTAIDGVI